MAISLLELRFLREVTRALGARDHENAENVCSIHCVKTVFSPA